MKRREVKGKREKEKYTYLNAEFKEQQGEIRKPSSVIYAKKQRGGKEAGKDQRSQENERYQGNIHAKMGTIKDRNDTNKSRRY